MKNKFVGLFAAAAFILGAGALHAAAPIQNTGGYFKPGPGA